MWWWGVSTFIYNCVWIFLFIAKETQIFLKLPKMSCNGQSNMFFGKIISYTCDLHLKLEILNPLNIIFCQMVNKMNPFPHNPFLQNLKTLKFLYNLVFHQVHLMNMYFHRRGHAFVVQKVWIKLYDFMHSFWFF